MTSLLQIKERYTPVAFSKLAKGDYFFFCNEGSSDRGTRVYALKHNGKFIAKLWLDNGRLKDIAPGDRKNMGDLYDLLVKVSDL